MTARPYSNETCAALHRHEAKARQGWMVHALHPEYSLSSMRSACWHAEPFAPLRIHAATNRGMGARPSPCAAPLRAWT
jgi:hypothetical protein